jgi:tRNA pseudouridine55 synthase
LDGIINVNKPAGMTSFRVVAIVKRLSGEKRVGHAGTLDPDATGVLPVCLGKGTRVVPYLAEATKTYRAEVELGAATDTYDASGIITQKGDCVNIDREMIEAALRAFRGEIQQTPPMYSALKHKGQPLYTLARAGITIERKSRPITIHRLEIIDWQPPVVTLEIECSKGTYIRSIAHDLGQALGCGAFLKNLERTRCGIFDIKDAVPLLQLEEAFSRGEAVKLIFPPDHALKDLPAIVVDETGEAALVTGGAIAAGQVVSGGDNRDKPKYRAYSAGGRFLGIVRYEAAEGTWRPEKVFVQG